jgi:HK97 family phage portal protein
MNFLQKLFLPKELKALSRTYVLRSSRWNPATWFDVDWASISEEGYRKNSAFFACLSVWAFSFPEPPLRWYGKDDAEVPKHPTRLLLDRPNEDMGEAELMLHTIIYAGIGGNAYWHKIRNSSGKVIELRPYHIGNIQPVKEGTRWIDHYTYDDGSGYKVPLPKEDIVHFKWPSVDINTSGLALPPLIPVLREVATDNEAIRYLKAILQNDAVPRVILSAPADSDLDLGDEEKQERLKSQFRNKYGGDNRGDVAILTGGLKAERVALDLQELQFSAIHAIPEGRIAAALRVSPMMAGLNVGLEHSTFNNYEEAVRSFTTGPLSSVWRLFASEIWADKDLNPNNDTVRFDTSLVRALQEDTDAKWARYQAAFSSGAITINDFLKGVGLPEERNGNIRLIEASKIQVDLNAPQLPATTSTNGTTQPNDALKQILGYHIEQGVVSRNEARERLGLPAEDESQSNNLRNLTAILTVLKLALDARISPEDAIRLVGLTGVSIAEPEPQPAFGNTPPQLTDGGINENEEN